MLTHDSPSLPLATGSKCATSMHDSLIQMRIQLTLIAALCALPSTALADGLVRLSMGGGYLTNTTGDESSGAALSRLDLGVALASRTEIFFLAGSFITDGDGAPLIGLGVRQRVALTERLSLYGEAAVMPYELGTGATFALDQTWSLSLGASAFIAPVSTRAGDDHTQWWLVGKLGVGVFF